MIGLLRSKPSIAMALALLVFLVHLEGNAEARLVLPAIALNKDGIVGPERLPYSKLDWTLNQIISALESEGYESDEDLAARALIHLGGAVGISVSLLEGAYVLAEELTAVGGKVRVANDVFLEGFVPIRSLAMLDSRAEIVRVDAAMPATPAVASGARAAR